MGMFTGSFTVVDSDVTQGIPPTSLPQVAQAAAPSNGGSACAGKGGCGCGGGKKVQPTPVEAPPAEVEDTTQVIKTTYTYDDDIKPNTFTVKAGKPVRMEITVNDDGSGCMGSIMVPGLTDPQMLTKGKNISFTFTPKAGEYPITCAMGIPRGKIKVI